MAITGGTVETLDEIPAHVWRGLPDCLSLGPSAINQSRIGEYISVSALLRRLQLQQRLTRPLTC